MSSFESQQAEIERLKAALAVAEADKLKLEEECDLLAFDNDRLNGEVTRLKATVESYKAANLSLNNLSLNDTETTEGIGIFVEGDNKFANSLKLKILDANSGKNVICTTFLVDGEDDILLTGGVDGALNGFNSSGVRLFSYKLTAPVLAIDVHGLVIACSLMDGGHAVIELEHDAYENQAMTTFQDHSKYVVAVKFSPDGILMATASHDKSVNIYKRSGLDEVFEKVKTVQFTHTPESILFVPAGGKAHSTVSNANGGISESVVDTVSSGTSGAVSSTGNHDTQHYELIIGLRGLAHLVYLDCADFESQRLVSLNEKDWDNHVSYTPLYLSASPDGKLLLIATDKNMHYIVRMGTNIRVRVLAGHCCGDYGKPVVSWDCTGRYIYCNSDEDSAVYIYSLASERVVGKLSKGGHKGIVRGVACHPTKRLVLSASYDKSVILWEHSE